jgi:hypothetical protein
MKFKHISKSQNESNDVVPTVFHITHYKAGSQWVYAVLNEIVPQRIVTPQVAARHVTHQPMIAGGVYPCVYLPRKTFYDASPPKNHRVFIILRDLRDTLISLYFSVKHSHQMINPAQQKLRDMLLSVDLADGLIHLMEHRLVVSAGIQKSWIHSDELLIRYEDLNTDQHKNFKKILSFCSLDISDKALKQAIDKHSFEKRAGRKPGTEDVSSHHRKGIVGDWRNYFDPRVKEEFKRRFGELLIETGYEKDVYW